MNTIEQLKPKYSIEQIETFISEDEFIEAYVELLKQSIELLIKINELVYSESDGTQKILDKDNAVIGGNLARLIKLSVSFLQNTCERKLEITQILGRCIAETAINIKYILLKGESRVIRNYIKYSLITEKELWETILTNIKERNGDAKAIEERMQSSIKESFEDSDFEIEEVRKSSKWKSFKLRSDAVTDEQFYSVFYGISSHSIHGNWQEILSNNLIKEGNGFKMNIEWNDIKPQIIDGPIVFNLSIVKSFCTLSDYNFNYKEELISKCIELREYQSLLCMQHEKWKNK